MGKIGDLVNRIISPLLNRSTDSQTVADPRRGRIGYVGNITLISQLINDVGYTTSEGTVTDVRISAGKFTGVTDDAPASDELIPNFKVPNSTSHLTNDGNGSSISKYGTGTITGLTKNNSSSGISISGSTATVTINWKNGDYENDIGYTNNSGNVVTLQAVAGKPDGVGINPDGTVYSIKIPTHTSHLDNNTYITTTNNDHFVKINTTKSITVTNNIFEKTSTSPLTQDQINNFKLYKCGNMYTFFGQYVQSGISANPGYVSLFNTKGLNPNFATDPNYIVIGNGIARWINDKGYARATPVVITCSHINYSSSSSEIGMLICSLSTGSFSSSLNYTIYISGTIFSSNGPT